MTPDWKYAPPWANFLVKDFVGWEWHEEEPKWNDQLGTYSSKGLTQPTYCDYTLILKRPIQEEK